MHRQRGAYLKLSETGGRRPRSTVLLPAGAAPWLHALVDFYAAETRAGCGRLGFGMRWG